MAYRRTHPGKDWLPASLGATADLEEGNVRLLRRLESVSEPRACGQLLWGSNDPIKQLYVLQNGWACSYRDEQDGRRRIIDVFLPGDILGLKDYTFSTHGSDAAMLSHGRVASFSLHELIDLVQASTRLAIALLNSAARQANRFTLRMLANRHRDPSVRLAHFLKDIHLRLREAGKGDATHFYCPLSRSQLGSLLELSGPQVDSALGALEAAKIMKRHRHHIELRDQERLFHAAGLAAPDRGWA
ncbi:Crp/Fnr family transcriptional regulator [Pistricoccus aurantiacus]|nr:Crp/Fnr family transcriptional regulator [Pistricoccus aurantiacus]